MQRKHMSGLKLTNGNNMTRWINDTVTFLPISMPLKMVNAGYGGLRTPKIFLPPPLEKCIGLSLKLLEIV